MSDDILIEMIQNQRKDLPINKKLVYNDLRRISKYLNNSIFNSDDCCLWNGYISPIKNDDKNYYINFYFNGKRHSLQRLLYYNFVGDINNSEYIKYYCTNKSKCCNIKHFYKIDKNTSTNIINIINNNDKINKDIIVDFNL